MSAVNDELERSLTVLRWWKSLSLTEREVIMLREKEKHREEIAAKGNC